ncbi:MAG: CDGSH iron-sulfur domain-containing protein [Actinomycetales bacterium]
MSEQTSPTATAQILVGENGPYEVRGVRVERTRVINDEHGHAREYETYAQVHDGAEPTWLCRCGHSKNKPFCDGSHHTAGPDGGPFDGTENAPTNTYRERAEVLGGDGVQVSDDRGICVHAGFCATHGANVWREVKQSQDPQVRDDMTTRIDKCPSGALTRRPEADAPDDEPDYPRAVHVVADGPLHVTGRVQVTRADGETFETRNRMTLCRCGASAIKPLCDGSHAETGFTDS